MADIIQLHAPKTPPKEDIDPRFRGIGDRLIAAGFEIEQLRIDSNYGCLEIWFSTQEDAQFFFCSALTGDSDSRILTSKYDSYCRLCGKLTSGDQIYWCPSDRPEPIRKYRRKAVNPAAKSRELWVENLGSAMSRACQCPPPGASEGA